MRNFIGSLFRRFVMWRTRRQLQTAITGAPLDSLPALLALRDVMTKTPQAPEAREAPAPEADGARCPRVPTTYCPECGERLDSVEQAARICRFCEHRWTRCGPNSTERAIERAVRTVLDPR